MAAAAAVSAAGTLASGLAGIGSGIGNGISQKKTNDLNLQINRENNEFNRQMMEEQMRYNTEMYERSLSDSRETWEQQFNAVNEYNDPSAQLDRLQRAGVNRQLAAAGLSGSSSTASPTSTAGTSSGATPAQSHGIQLQAPKYDLSGLQGAVAAGVDMYTKLKNTESNTALTDEQRIGAQLSNQFYIQRVMSEIFRNNAAAGYDNARSMTEQEMRPLYVQKAQSDILNGLQNYQRLQQVTKSIRIQNAMDSIRLENLPEQIKLDLAQKVASIAESYSRQELNKSEAKKALQDVFESAARTSGIQAKNSLFYATVDQQIERIEKENIILQKQIDSFLPPREAKLWDMGKGVLDTAGDFLLYKGMGGLFRRAAKSAPSMQGALGYPMN